MPVLKSIDEVRSLTHLGNGRVGAVGQVWTRQLNSDGESVIYNLPTRTAMVLSGGRPQNMERLFLTLLASTFPLHPSAGSRGGGGGGGGDPFSAMC